MVFHPYQASGGSMTRIITILFVIALGIQSQHAFASHQLEGFFGTYHVIEPRSCSPEDSWCKHLKKVYVGLSSSEPNKAVIIEYGPESQQSQTTLLVEIPCGDLGNCPESANIEGFFPIAGWSYIKNIPSTSFERHDYQGVTQDRKFQSMGDFVAYEYTNSVTKGIDYSTTDIRRSYKLKKL